MHAAGEADRLPQPVDAEQDQAEAEQGGANIAAQTGAVIISQTVAWAGSRARAAN